MTSGSRLRRDAVCPARRSTSNTRRGMSVRIGSMPRMLVRPALAAC